MLKIRIESDQLKAELDKVKARVRNLSAFHRQVTRPFLLRQFGIAYHAAGIGVRSGRLLASLTDPTHPEHFSQITSTSIIEGTRVPYARFVEGRNPITHRVARSHALIQLIEQTLPDHLTS